MPALLTSTSILPRSAIARTVALSTEAGSATSTLSFASRSQTRTFAPEASRRFTMAAPMPCMPPVTTAVRPLKSSWFMSFLYGAGHCRHVVFDEEGIQDDQRQGPDQRTGHE